MNKLRAIHSGKILREEFLVSLGLLVSAMAVRPTIPAPPINGIVRERCFVLPDSAPRLGSRVTAGRSRNSGWTSRPTMT